MFSYYKIIIPAVCCNAVFAFFCGAAFAEAIQITDHAATDNRPAWCPTRNEIAFKSDRTGNSELYITSSIGGGPVYLAHFEYSDPATDTDPAWSPDGTHIAFASDRDGSFDIWIGQGYSEAIQLTSGPSIDAKPSWSPDGSLIAFASNGGSGNEIWVVPSSGGSPTQLTSSGGTYPTWSPDASHIAYAGPSGDIWIIPSTGGTPVQLTSDPADDSRPAWSPQDGWVAFSSERSGNSDIWVIPATGGTPVQLTTDPASDTRPTWSPDGAQLAFASDRSGNWDIWRTGSLIGIKGEWTYLYVPANEPPGAVNAVPVELWQLGINPGDLLRIRQMGTFSNGPAGDTLTRMIGVFSGSDVLLGPTVHPRVQDAIDAGTDFVTGDAYWDGGPTDIPEDFWIDDVEIVVPAGATHLFVTSYDTGYWDNGDPNGDFAVWLVVQPDPSGTQQGGFPQFSQLKQNVPNPFNPQTTITFDLPKQTVVRLAVYDVSGRLVDVLLDGDIAAQGRNEVVWRGRDSGGRIVPAGVYFYRLEAGSYSETKRMVLVK